MRRQELTFLIVGMILAAVAGGLVGNLVGSFLPEGTIKTLFTTDVEIGLGRTVGLEQVEPLTLNLYAITLVLGLTLKINFVSVLFVLLVFVYFQWWYL
ncbi:MAG: DUF4321 domain-containing protein [candidate division Zixibacteria bacterium]|nr:DUF4321 domain-containing protein [candidate division Zixibacteria bacterium]